MLVICRECDKRHVITRSSRDVEVVCECGNTLHVFPWLEYTQKFHTDHVYYCRTCDRTYDFNLMRNNSEVACGCGDLHIVQTTEVPSKKPFTRRKDDRKPILHKKELYGLIDISRLIYSAAGSFNDLIQLTILIVRQMLESREASIVLVDEETGKNVFYAVAGESSSQLERLELEPGEGIVGDCIVKAKEEIVNNVKDDPRFSDRPDQETGFLTRSLLCVPLIVDKTCIGALEVVNKMDGTDYTEYDLQLAVAVTNQIAIAIHNVRLKEHSLKIERLAAIGETITGAAHFVKNLLNGLAGGMYILKKDVSEALNGKSSKGIDMLERNMERLTALVQDMLTYSKKRKPDYSPGSLNEVLESVVSLMEPKARENGVIVDFAEHGRINHEVAFDSKGMFRSVLNLVSNGIDACSGLENGRISVFMDEDDDEVRINIKDNGCGMDEKTRLSVFQPFFSSKGSKGTGLGLSVTQKVIEEHGGRIEVESEPGRGSTFILCIPNRIEVPLTTAIYRNSV